MLQPITDLDQYLFHQGTHYESYQFLGAHYDPKSEMTTFTVWAPHAYKISLGLDVNNWTGADYPLNRVTDAGLWHAEFKIAPGTTYKYVIDTENGRLLKADPYARYAQRRPRTASIVEAPSSYEWQDEEWLTQREKTDYFKSPINIYEVHLGTWRKHEVDQGDLSVDEYTDLTYYTYREMAEEMVPYVKEMGYSHVEILPVTEHPFDLSWGYQVTGYYAPTSRFGTPDDFKYLVDSFHQAGIGVIMDWVPAHFCKDEHGLRQFDGKPLYEHQDIKRAVKKGWGTLTFDYGRPEIQSFLISNANYWLTEFHLDGLRVDAVHSMTDLNFENHTPDSKIYNDDGTSVHKEGVAFIQKLNTVIFEYHPHVLMMAEDSSDIPMITAPVDKGGLGFNYKWDLGFMHDTLDYFELPQEARQYHHQNLTFPMMYRYNENYILPFSHDEVVHGKLSMLDKMPGDQWQKFANLRALYGYQMTQPGKKLLFMGSELGLYSEWKDKDQIDWFILKYPYHHGMQKYVRALNHFYLSHPSLFADDYEPEGYEWIDPDNNKQSVVTYLRKSEEEELIIAINMTGQVYYDFEIEVPEQAGYKEIFSSDAEEFGGSNQLVSDELFAVKSEKQGYKYVIRTKLPPFGISIYQQTAQIKNVGESR
ncbi:1,4-alpha-glucan branching protein GlgB [Macrococcus brunensis]|uniref:1,4-alpha-glucan branching enzyme GlgB n=1 Tax=Macrococcus brunensis TaxID=198483 RepID=A0A4R6BFZ1_9STAP|nr:1,4-alpha-glucan branching protein GlgB [Macrococcus brunensis]TDL98749.1 1,4-alpha-glucan branching protein GlgB [Macrococcus brunensis]